MKNNFELAGNDFVIIIKHKGSKYKCFIDEDVFDTVNAIKTTWNLNVNRTGHLDGIRTKVQIEGVRKQIWIHRLITNCPDNLIVDHIDGDIFNNKRANLRATTNSVNSRNSKIQKKTSSGIRNIYTEKGRFAIRINNKRYGSYKTLEEAIPIANTLRIEAFPECQRQ
jgi:hypothetical protein